MKKQDISVKTVIAIDIGAAVFVALECFIVIPTGSPNTNIRTSYAFLALISTIFGPFAGLMTGLVGHVIKDFTAYGSAWWGWVIYSGIISCLCGWVELKLNLSSGRFSRKSMIYFNISQIIANIIYWALIAPTLDILIYNELANKIYTRGVISAVLDIISVGIIGTILLKAYASPQIEKGSLYKEQLFCRIRHVSEHREAAIHHD